MRPVQHALKIARPRHPAKPGYRLRRNPGLPESPLRSVVKVQMVGLSGLAPNFPAYQTEIRYCSVGQCPRRGSNPRRAGCKPAALPLSYSDKNFSGGTGNRTQPSDLQSRRQAHPHPRVLRLVWKLDLAQRACPHQASIRVAARPNGRELLELLVVGGAEHEDYYSTVDARTKKRP